MKVRIKVEPTGDGRCTAEASGVRSFGVSPTLGDTRTEAVDRACSAVLCGLASVVEQGRARAPRGLTFVVSNGRRLSPPRPPPAQPLASPPS
jgi:hypothetical protein